MALDARVRSWHDCEFATTLIVALLCLFAFQDTHADPASDRSEQTVVVGEHEIETSLVLEGRRRSLLPDGDTATSHESESAASLEVDLHQQLSSRWWLDAGLALGLEHEKNPDHPEGKTRSGTSLERLALFGSLGRNRNASLGIGRQEFFDESGWWWDATLDAVSLQAQRDEFTHLIAFGVKTGDDITNLQTSDPEDEEVYWLLADSGIYEGEHFSAHFFGMHEHDVSGLPGRGKSVSEENIDESDARLTWLGLRLQYELIDNRAGVFTLDINSAYLSGRTKSLQPVGEREDESDGDDTAGDSNDETDDDKGPLTESLPAVVQIRAWAVDAVWRWQLRLPFGPHFSVRHAVASGCSSDCESGRGRFRQSRLHSNEDSFGLNGELYAPELSNLQLLALEVGAVISPGVRLNLVHYRFQRFSRRDSFVQTGIEAEVEGTSRVLGRETSLQIAAQLWEDVDLTASLSLFEPGSAYALQDSAHSILGRFELEVEF